MAKNKLSDLNNHLFSQIERLSNENLSRENLETEIERTKAITAVAGKVIDNAKLTLDAVKTAKEWGIKPGDGVLGLSNG